MVGVTTTTTAAGTPSARSTIGAVSAERERAAVWRVLEGVPDPEIPILSIVDLGIVRHVRRDSAGELHVGLTPTYSGCPATEVIRASVERALARGGYAGAVVDTVLSPAWTSDWLSDEGRQKLESFGIAPPAESVSSPRRLLGSPVIACPRCHSKATERLSEFGSTPCKAHYRCTACLEPFDYFKCI
ncbi:MAG TPA: 1,2-phenylacetyl-CoA epoxidase subunit PaaD [Steroidobacteraceae bacterium]|nr:1,2-phenylacetyl-CoA epoxidase subunit PaaD [Steroidobacteraceae bacterium]